MKNVLKVGKYELITKNGEKQRLTIAIERVETCEFCGAEHSIQIDSCYDFFGIESILGCLPDEWQAVFETAV